MHKSGTLPMTIANIEFTKSLLSFQFAIIFGKTLRILSSSWLKCTFMTIFKHWNKLLIMKHSFCTKHFSLKLFTLKPKKYKIAQFDLPGNLLTPCL